MKAPALLVVALLGSGIGVLATACTEEPTVTEGACQMVIEACHTKDDGSDDVINGCHSRAHEGDDAVCSEDLQHCLDTCNAAPEVGVYATDHGSDTDHDQGTGSTGDHEGSGTTGDHHDGTETSNGTTGSPGTGSTGADDSSEASCEELGSLCHDTATEFGTMCHDIGHDGDEAACAEVWVACLEECTA